MTLAAVVDSAVAGAAFKLTTAATDTSVGLLASRDLLRLSTSLGACHCHKLLYYPPSFL